MCDSFRQETFWAIRDVLASSPLSAPLRDRSTDYLVELARPLHPGGNGGGCSLLRQARRGANECGRATAGTTAAGRKAPLRAVRPAGGLARPRSSAGDCPWRSFGFGGRLLPRSTRAAPSGLPWRAPRVSVTRGPS